MCLSIGPSESCYEASEYTESNREAVLCNRMSDSIGSRFRFMLSAQSLKPFM